MGTEPSSQELSPVAAIASAEASGKPNPLEATLFQQDLEHALTALRQGGEYHFTTQLPRIVGSIEPDDREAFERFIDEMCGDKGLGSKFKGYRAEPRHDTSSDWYGALAEFAPLYEPIRNDLLALGIWPVHTWADYRRYPLIRVHHRDLFKPNGPWHTDGSLFGGKFPTGPTYIISDRFGTEFYSGPAVFTKMPYEKGGRVLWSELEIHIDQNKPPIIAPPYAIVRLTPATIHRAPAFPDDAERRFLRFAVDNPMEL